MTEERVKPRTAKSSLRLRLLATLAVALTPIFLLSGIQAWINAEQSLDQRRLELIDAADDAIDDLAQTLATAESYLQFFEPEILEGGCGEVFERLSTVIPSLNNVVRFNIDGISECTAIGEPGFPITRPAAFERLRLGAEIVRTDAFEGPVSHTQLFAIHSRVETAFGAFDGSVSFGINAERLAEFLHNRVRGDNIDISIASTDGRVFGSSVISQFEPDWLNELETNEGNALFPDVQIGDERHDVVIERIGQGGVYVLLTRPSPGLFSEFAIAPASAIGLPFLAFLLVLAAVWVAVDRLVLKWLARLKRIAFIYGAGRYKIRAGESFSSAPEEILELALTLDQMAEKIESRDGSLREALGKRDAAVREIHHRVKNNLQIVTSFLNLQSRQVSDQGAKSALASARHRIDALSIVHQTLYQHERLEAVSLKPFLDGLLNHLSEALGFEDTGIEASWDLQDADRDADDAIPLALFALEAVTNAIKHGPTFGGKIHIEMTRDAEARMLNLKITNTARPVGEDDEESNSTGLGSKLMTAFSRQLRGELSSGPDGNGNYVVQLSIPEPTEAKKPFSAV
ncbi:MAG: hypothetical protein CMK08_07155 [Ponticaulis sp.]|nr:hypothetical protein [Ponticaulis sp.]